VAVIMPHTYDKQSPEQRVRTEEEKQKSDLYTADREYAAWRIENHLPQHDSQTSPQSYMMSRNTDLVTFYAALYNITGLPEKTFNVAAIRPTVRKLRAVGIQQTASKGWRWDRQESLTSDEIRALSWLEANGFAYAEKTTSRGIYHFVTPAGAQWALDEDRLAEDDNQDTP